MSAATVSGRRSRMILRLAGLAVLLTLYPHCANACSLVGCVDKGQEARSDFEVQVKHQNRPLSGVEVKVLAFENKQNVRFKGETDLNGSVVLSNLPPGRYWIDVDKMGIGAGYHCFHVRAKPSRKAKRSFTYEWRDTPQITVSTLRGKLLRVSSGQGGTQLWNALHPVESPIANAPLELKNPLTDGITSLITDEQGEFRFDAVTEGVYVLSTGGVQSRSFVIRITHSAKETPIELVVRENVSYCGEGPPIDIQVAREAATQSKEALR